jgi:pyruvate/2-oxoglutarate dehydrogenase complex dihydrolipoamide dehydrogenase (E3) component
MADYDYDIGVIGGGAAGLTVTSGAAQLGAKTLLVEKEKELGGDCLHFGCVPSKTLIKTAQVYHMMKNAERYGLPAVQTPPVDFKNVSQRIKSVIEVIQKHDSKERFCRLGAKVEFGVPVFTDEHSIQLNGKAVSAKSWVIATGSSPFIPPIKGLDETGYITNKEIFYLDRLPKSMVIMGGGPIGSEMGQAFNRLGTKVYIVNRGDQILGKEDRDMADTVKKVMESEGVEFYLNASIEAARNLGNEKEVLITDKDGKAITLKAEAIMVSVGRTPNIGQMGLDDIGVKVNRFGIEVDKRLRTNHKHIYAAGDVNGGYLFTHAAGYEGGIVVSNAVFRLPRNTDYTYLPWCTYTDPELASIGMNEKTAEARGIEYSIIVEEFKNNDRSLAEGERIGKIKMLLNGKEKPIGIQIVGPHAGDLVSEWVAVLNGKVKLSTLAAAVHPYPTIGEINKKVAGTFFTPKIFSDKIKKGLKFFFNLKGRACGLEPNEE